MYTFIRDTRKLLKRHFTGLSEKTIGQQYINKRTEQCNLALKQQSCVLYRSNEIRPVCYCFISLQVATTVFTPLEFGTVGLSEEKAIDAYGEDNIEVRRSVT